MKYAFAAAAAALALAGVALAQTPTAPVAAPAVAAPIPPSTCPVYPPQPAVPSADAIRDVRALNIATATVNTYLGQYSTVHQCHINEVNALDAQTKARVTEAKAAQDSAKAFRDNWEQVTMAITARNAAKQKGKR